MSSSSEKPWIIVSGVRSSWETVDTSEDLSWSTSRSWETSRTTTTAPASSFADHKRRGRQRDRHAPAVGPTPGGGRYPLLATTRRSRIAWATIDSSQADGVARWS